MVIVRLGLKAYVPVVIKVPLLKTICPDVDAAEIDGPRFKVPKICQFPDGLKLKVPPELFTVRVVLEFMINAIEPPLVELS